MNSLTIAVLFACLLGVAVCQTDSPSTCPEGWSTVCTRPLAEFTAVNNPKKYCRQIGYVGNKRCHIAPGQLVTPNGCCEYGK